LATSLKGKTLLAYVAGIMDGEGCIGLHTNYKNPSAIVTVVVKNTNEWLIKFLQMNFGGYILYQKTAWRNLRAKPSWIWEVRSKKACAFLLLVLPYLQIKKPQAELALNFQKRRTGGGRGKRLTDEIKMLDSIDKSLMHKMNQRGIPQKEA